MSQWITASGQIIDTAAGQGITENGTYTLNRARMDRGLPFVFGVRVGVAGHTGTVQLFSNILGVKSNLGTALVPANGAPAVGTEEYTLTGERGITVTGITGIIYPEAIQ